MVSLPLDYNRWNNGTISPSQKGNMIFRRRLGETRKNFFTPKKNRTYDLPISDFRYILYDADSMKNRSTRVEPVTFRWIVCMPLYHELQDTCRNRPNSSHKLWFRTVLLLQIVPPRGLWKTAPAQAPTFESHIRGLAWIVLVTWSFSLSMDFLVTFSTEAAIILSRCFPFICGNM